jgi:hypothetical protein
MKPRREDLDERIDRVAAELTYVPADGALADRIVAQLAKPAPSRLEWRTMWAPAVVAVAVIAAALLWLRPAAPPQPIVASAPSVAPLPAVVQPAQTAVARVDGASDGRALIPAAQRRWVPAARLITHQREVAQLDPLPAPESLIITDLSSELLTIAPVAIEPLDLANLVVDGEGRDQPKE